MIALGRPTLPTPDNTATSAVSLHKPRHRAELRMTHYGREMSLALCHLGAHMSHTGPVNRCPSHNPAGYAKHVARHRAVV